MSMHDLVQAETSEIPDDGMDLRIQHPRIEVIGWIEAPHWDMAVWEQHLSFLPLDSFPSGSVVLGRGIFFHVHGIPLRAIPTCLNRRFIRTNAFSSSHVRLRLVWHRSDGSDTGLDQSWFLPIFAQDRSTFVPQVTHVGFVSTAVDGKGWMMHVRRSKRAFVRTTHVLVAASHGPTDAGRKGNRNPRSERVGGDSLAQDIVRLGRSGRDGGGGDIDPLRRRGGIVGRKGGIWTQMPWGCLLSMPPFRGTDPTTAGHGQHRDHDTSASRREAMGPAGLGQHEGSNEWQCLHVKAIPNDRR